MSRVHHLKTWPEYFESIMDGTKTFEVRKNDRDFKVGDHLYLEEYDPETGRYSGKSVHANVWYCLCGPCFGIEDGYVVMSIIGGVISAKRRE
jgi:hypothetical protein